jgi:D-sedoheptulose 7-phosphate isomerase
VTSLNQLLQGVKDQEVEAPAQVAENGSFSATFIAEAITILGQVDTREIEHMAWGLAQLRQSGGRLFILGVGGSAGHAGHAVNDFRKICGFEAYAPTDNVSELTARANDEGWDSCFSSWLDGSRINSKDGVLVFSVGGGSVEKNISVNIVRALETAVNAGAHIFGIVGRDGGFTQKVSESCILIPTVVPDRVTPHTEGLCAVIWHLLVSHPQLKREGTKWESVK